MTTSQHFHCYYASLIWTFAVAPCGIFSTSPQSLLQHMGHKDRIKLKIKSCYSSQNPPVASHLRVKAGALAAVCKPRAVLPPTTSLHIFSHLHSSYQTSLLWSLRHIYFWISILVITKTEKKKSFRNIRKFIMFKKAVVRWHGRALESMKTLKYNACTGSL